MNDSVTVLNLLTESHGLILVHGPNLIESVFITLLKSFKLLLKKQEFFGELLILLCSISILLAIPLILRIKSNFNGCKYFLELSLLSLETLDLDAVYLFSFVQDSVIEFEFFLVQSVYSFHVFHAFLENLHFLLELDFLFSLIVGVLGSELFELFSVFVLLLLSLPHVVVLELLMLLEQLFNFIIVSCENFGSLRDEVVLDVFNLSAVIASHFHELMSHAFDELIDIIVLFLESFHIILILALKLLHEALDQLILLSDDLLTSFFLNLDVL
jgi:hypothetical protein